MKQYLFLIVFGLGSGGAFIAGTRYAVSFLGVGPLASSEATHFSSLEEFHRKMVTRDDRDEKGDSNVSLRSIITPHPNPKIMYDMLPDQSVQFQGVPVRLNSCGLRGVDRAIEKPDNVIRIAFLGDSFTFGWGVEEEHSFVEVTGEILNRYLDGQDTSVEMLNLGIPGYSTFQEVELFLKERKEFQPDIVVVFFIQNDFGVPFFIGGIGDDGKMVRSTAFAKLGKEEGSEDVQADKDRVVNMLDPNKALRDLVKDSRKNAYQVYLAFNPHPKWKENLKRLWFVRKSSKLPIINIRPRFLEAMESFEISEGDLSLPDDPHPSALKHSILGALLAEDLLPEVSRLAALNVASDDLRDRGGALDAG